MPQESADGKVTKLQELARKKATAVKLVCHHGADF